MTKRTVPARVLILVTLDLGCHDSHVHTSWFWTLQGEGNRRADTEGYTKRSRRGHRADRGREKRRPKDSESSFISPNSDVSGEGLDLPGRWRTAYLGHAAVGQERAGAAGRERERRSQEPWSPSPERVPRHPHALGGGAAPGTMATHQDDRAQTADEKGTDAHAEGQDSTRGSVQRKRPGQPSPTLPRHATPLLRPHTHQGPAPSYDAPQALPCPSHLAAPLTTVLSLRHPRPHHGHVPKSQVRPRPLAGPRPATSSVLPRLRGARLVHVHPPLC